MVFQNNFFWLYKIFLNFLRELPFNETAHVEELKKKAPIFHSMLQASAFKTKGSQSDS